MEPAALSCSNPHSKMTSATFPSLRLSRAANSSSSARSAWRTRRLSCAFHSPIGCLNTSRKLDKQRKHCPPSPRVYDRFVSSECGNRMRRAHIWLRLITHQTYNNTTSARCFTMYFSAGFLGLGRPTALALLAFSLQLAEVFRASLGDLLPTLPSKLDGGGIFFLRQNSAGLALISSPYYARTALGQAEKISHPRGQLRASKPLFGARL